MATSSSGVRTPRRARYKPPPPVTTPCEPTGPLAPLHGETANSGTCACGDPVTQVWSAEARDWLVRSDADGGYSRSVPKPPVHPAIIEQMRGNRKITPLMLEQYEATHVGWGVEWPFPIHWHRLADPPPYSGECPTCHGWPMQAVAHGWRCRTTSRIHLTGSAAA
jgi:hypothetical protein